RYPKAALVAFLPYGLFLGWMSLRSVATHYGQAELQNGVVYALFGAQFLLGATLAASHPVQASQMIRRGILALDTIGLGLVAVSLLLFGLPGAGFNEGDWLVGPRSVGMLGIVAVSWHAAQWCHGRPWAAVRGIAWILAVLLS